jgi:hypothetical protein
MTCVLSIFFFCNLVILVMLILPHLNVNFQISGIEGYDYNSVSKWTDKIGYELLECDKVNMFELIFIFFFFL